MTNRTAFNEFLVLLSTLSPIILTILIILLFIKHENKTILYLIIILVLSYLFEKYEYHHIIPVVSFYLFNTLQVWLDLLLDTLPNIIPDTIPIIGTIL